MPVYTNAAFAHENSRMRIHARERLYAYSCLLHPCTISPLYICITGPGRAISVASFILAFMLDAMSTTFLLTQDQANTMELQVVMVR